MENRYSSGKIIRMNCEEDQSSKSKSDKTKKLLRFELMLLPSLGVKTFIGVFYKEIWMLVGWFLAIWLAAQKVLFNQIAYKRVQRRFMQEMIFTI